ncbi:MAG: hypothetical protein WCJ09_01285 [Planctomycetota bacterium]
MPIVLEASCDFVTPVAEAATGATGATLRLEVDALLSKFMAENGL